ncbi:unnamed protein product [Symbiodinium sp. CCMP2592]|nr:unnamed protein product [Symbiodinium sp. CCMP2592]
MDADNIHFAQAKEASEQMVLRELHEHVFSSPTQLMTHFLDVSHDVTKTNLDIDNLKGIFKNKAWSDLPAIMKLKGNPSFDYKTQYFIQEQSNGNYTIIKHVYLTKQRFAIQAVLALSKKRLVASSAMGATSTEDDQDAGWDFILEHGERDRSQLKQLRWIHKNINRDGSPIRGWSEKLVQKALDPLTNDNCLAKLITRYDLTVQDLHPTFVENIFQDAVGFLLDHSLWLMGQLRVIIDKSYANLEVASPKDKATFDKRDISNELDFKHLMKNKKTAIMWEQWAGCIQRGHPQSLVLQRLTPKVTVKRAPGPGAIRRVEWKQIGTKLLKDRNVVLQTDSANSYKLVIPGVIHDRVVHCRKRVKQNGKYTWMHPKYVSIVKHTLPKSKKILSVKSGTQVIDRCWRFLKDHIQINQHSKAGSRLLRAKLRAAQYEYWYRNTDLWLKCRELCADHMKLFM